MFKITHHSKTLMTAFLYKIYSILHLQIIYLVDDKTTKLRWKLRLLLWVFSLPFHPSPFYIPDKRNIPFCKLFSFTYISKLFLLSPVCITHFIATDDDDTEEEDEVRTKRIGDLPLLPESGRNDGVKTIPSHNSLGRLFAEYCLYC